MGIDYTKDLQYISTDIKNTGRINLNKDALYGNKYVNIRNDQLYLDKISVSKMVDDNGTPCFMFLENKIRENITQIQTCFQGIFPKTAGFYSIKANYLPEIIEIVKNMNFGAEIISDFELNLLIQCHFPPSHIIAGGPYLPESFLIQLLSYGISLIVVYDLDDLMKIARVQASKPQFSKIEIILRFTNPKYTGRHGIRYTLKNIQYIKEFIEQNPQIRIVGIASHLGTQMNSYEEYRSNFRFLNDIYQTLQNNSKLKQTIQYINIGGGFPNADSLPYKQLTEIFSKLKKEFDHLDWNSLSLLYEPGRYILGDAGFCTASIIKLDQEYHTAILNIGTQFIPKFMKSSLRFYDIDKIIDSPNSPIDFMGPIPSDEDLMIKKYYFPPSVAKGDRVLIANVGAYALTFSTRFPYNTPHLFLITGDQVRKIEFLL